MPTTEKQSNVIIAEYGKVLEDVLTTYARNLTKFTGFTRANKIGLLSKFTIALGVDGVPRKLAKCIPVYIYPQTMIWAGQEYSDNSVQFDERCPELYKIFSNTILKKEKED